VDKKLKQRACLNAYKETGGNITRAAECVGITRQTHYDWLESDPEYVEEFKKAEQEAADRLEEEARRRAVEGWEEPVFHKGKVVGAVRKYSDALLIFLLKGAKPEKYKERVANEHSGKVEADVKVYHDLRKLSKEELDQLERILEKTSDSG